MMKAKIKKKILYFLKNKGWKIFFMRGRMKNYSNKLKNKKKLFKSEAKFMAANKFNRKIEESISNCYAKAAAI